MSYTLADIKGDENLIDAMGEQYAGDGRTYADELAAADTWAAVYEALVGACSIARMSGDACGAENIREAVGRYHAELIEGRTCAIYARSIERAVAHATR
jgi:GH15 family glucan-1,4-alpha-glucosidase